MFASDPLRIFGEFRHTVGPERMARPTRCGVGAPVTKQPKPVGYERIVAVGLLTQRDLEVLGEGFKRIFPVDEAPCFGELLMAIDDADRELWRERDEKSRRPSPRS